MSYDKFYTRGVTIHNPVETQKSEKLSLGKWRDAPTGGPWSEPDPCLFHLLYFHLNSIFEILIFLQCLNPDDAIKFYFSTSWSVSPNSVSLEGTLQRDVEIKGQENELVYVTRLTAS